MTRSLLALLGLGVFATTVAAQEPTPSPTPSPQAPAEEDVVKREEVVVVTASKVESTLINAPATVSVIGGEELLNAPSQNFGDILRNVPGVNVIQMSARDINLTSRQSTATLATSQLVLLDGRSVYLDFFGLVLWDLVPTNPQEIKQIEVVRGPASAVWGANALTGVVNIITKSPREWQGVNMNLTGGLFNRDEGSRADDGSGSSYGASISISRAPSPTWSYRLAGGYFNSDPFSRPTGRVPLIADPRVDNPDCNTTTGAGANCIGGAPYPTDGPGTAGTAFENEGTSQPKVDLRVDQDFTDGGKITYSAGFAGSEGIVHTGIGPFRLQSGSYLGYGRVAFSKNALKVSGFVNFLDSEAPNLLNLDPGNLPNPVQLNFKTETFDFEVGHSKVLAGAHILSYGGNARRNNFEITLTPNVEDRNEFGGYFQWEYFKDRFRISLGGRVDKFGNIEDPVFSPRATFMFKPAPEHAVRVSFNKAFRSPSAVNNFLNQDIFAPTLVDLRPLAPFAPPALRPALSTPFRLRVRNVGSEEVTPRYNLKEESLTAYEVSYTGTVGGKTTLGIAVYQNDSDDNINFTTVLPNASNPTGLPGFDVYTPANAPAIIGLNTSGQPVPGAIIGFLAALPRPIGPILLPRTATTYLNLGPLRQRGVELSLDHRLNNSWTVSGNYSFQDTPEPLEAESGQLPYLREEVALPAEHRFNAAVNWNESRFLGNLSVNYVDEALWTDVLTAPFHGMTDAYTMVNASFGVKWQEGKVVTTIKGTNLLNETVQQHIFGDIIKRSLLAELRLTF
jgi:outer membrane receptor protein involved in Fe transport